MQKTTFDNICNGCLVVSASVLAISTVAVVSSTIIKNASEKKSTDCYNDYIEDVKRLSD